MSLTSVLEDSRKLRGYLLATLPRPERLAVRTCLVPSEFHFASWIGTAFDYLLRWHLQAIYGATPCGPWIAEHALSSPWLRSEGLVQATRSVAKAKRRVNAFIRTKRATRMLLESALELARIDPIFRAPALRAIDATAYVGHPVPAAAVTELRRLIEIVPFPEFRPAKRLLLDPTFRASLRVGGADVDLLLDDMLLEIKTTKHGRVQRQAFNQILGYYLLFLAGGIEGLDSRVQIRRIGIYFSRQAWLQVWELDRIASVGTFRAASRRLLATADELFAHRSR